MLNDRSSILSLLETRRSAKPRELVDPGPTQQELERMLTIAARTPDHGKLFPWRFVTVAGDQRDALAVLFRQSLAKEDECALPAKHEKADEFAHYAGQLVVLISAPIPDHKIPVWEQELSAGAVCQNLLIAAHSLGFVASWLTEWYSYHPVVKQKIGLKPGERIAGFVYIGKSKGPVEERVRPDMSQIVTRF